METKEIIIPKAFPYPNNPDLPLVLYGGLFPKDEVRPESFESLLRSSGWGGCGETACTVSIISIQTAMKPWVVTEELRKFDSAAPTALY